MRNTRNWKHTTKQARQYEKHIVSKYETPFMTLDETKLKEVDDDDEGKM